MKPFKDMDISAVEKVYGVKILTNELYPFVDRDNMRRNYDYPAVSKFARHRGAARIMIDARISNDTRQDIAGNVESVVSEMTQQAKTATSRTPDRRAQRPDFISANVNITQHAMEAFMETTRTQRVRPAVHLTSSRSTQQDFDNRNTTAERNALWHANLAINSGYKRGAVICAAADAEVVKNTNPDFFVFATGAMLSDNLEVEPLDLRHERPALIEDTLDFVDVYLIGAPVFHLGAATTALDDRIAAARG
jgi:hypothetical protein